MFKPLSSVLAALLLALPAAAQDNAAEPFIAGVQADQALVIVSDNETTVIHEGAHSYNQITASPDGRWIAWRMLESLQSGSSLRVYDRETGYLHTVEIDISNGLPLSFTGALPITFTSDSQNLVFAFVDPDMQDDGPETLVTVMIQPIMDVGEAKNVRVPMQLSCGGGSSIPTEWRYWAETNGFGGNAPMLAVTPDGRVVYSMSCDGVGVAIVDPATNVTVEYPELSRAQYNPMTNDLLAVVMKEDVETSQLALLYLDTMALREFEISAQPNQLAITEDGLGAWFSVRSYNGPIPLTEAQIAGLVAGMGIDPANPPSLPQFVSTLHYLDFLTGSLSGALVTLPAYGVARIQPLDDTVYFSAVDNIDGWLEAIGDGTLDLRGSSFNEERATVGVTTYAYSPSDGTLSPLYTDITQPTVIALP